MARNKHPEETVNQILNVAYRLFMEKGYEHTSIQDILNNLGGLSKGAIYHHFKSKEEILETVTNRMTEESNKILAKIRDRKDLTGKEKLKMIFTESLNRPVQEEIFAAAPNISKSPTLLFSMFRDTVDGVSPNYILPIIREGVADGTIRTDCPEELAELIILLANIWMNPMVFDNSPEQIYRKFSVFRQMMQGFGLDILDEEIQDRMKELTAIYQSNR
ncbi:MAG: TetR/AcrR family transcriptional regulator [Ruminococcus sp.]|uniref:TetR/AcrR family transcriptional regulator n=1 Tax=Schaedlerella arabinosiphila TaxID=2044587 RepID=UPI0025582064|nr:TetR/AcrR family transcriptional regulator [Schaedlerella arabinosiphila]MCI9604289.1 TetR/AcrR family transcriptional regulator [Ruminococcus sp.]MCI9631653.1 TetR/AcrR family transcriptional regulator [Ruminococcus sp.]